MTPMADSRPVVISFVGESGSGKTSLLAAVAGILGSAGLSVAALKHTSSDFRAASAGKDTSRYEDAGIEFSGIVSDKKFSFTKNYSAPAASARDIAARYFSEADIVLAEGFKKERLAKILVGASPEGFSAASAVCAVPSLKSSGGSFSPATVRQTAAAAFIYYAVCVRHIFAGVGNRLKGDDAFGPSAADVFAAAGFSAADCGDVPENAANKIIAAAPEAIVIFDAVSAPAASTGFGLYAADELSGIQLGTHGGGIKMFIEYLKMSSSAKIAVVGARGASFALGDDMSPGPREAVAGLDVLARRIKPCMS